jgi:hypothetical protein
MPLKTRNIEVFIAIGTTVSDAMPLQKELEPLQQRWLQTWRSYGPFAPASGSTYAYGAKTGTVRCAHSAARTGQRRPHLPVAACVFGFKPAN